MTQTEATTGEALEPQGAADLPTAWRALVPLWDRSSGGWFAFDHDGLLRYANRAVADLTRRRPQLGTPDLIVDVVPAGRRAIQQRWQALRSGRTAAMDTVVPAELDGEARPFHLHVVAHDVAAGRWLVGTLRPIVHADGALTRAANVERTIARVMAELLSVAPPVSTEAVSTEDRLDDHLLSARQREILRLLIAGTSTAAIADRLSLSPHTVRNHAKAIFRAYGVHSRAELIARSRDPQVISPSS